MSSKNEEIRSLVSEAVTKGETVEIRDPKARSLKDVEGVPGFGEWESLPGVTDTYPSTSLADNMDDFYEERYGKE